MIIAISILTLICGLIGNYFSGKYALEAFADSRHYKSFLFFLFGVLFLLFFSMFLFIDVAVILNLFL